MTLQDALSSSAEIVVADDLPSARKVLLRILAKIGTPKVTECKNGAEVLAHLSAHEGVTIVISDRMMPDMNGIELLRSIRGHPGKHHLPFLLISSSVTEADAREVHAFENVEILLKPFTTGALTLKLEKLLASSAE